MALLGLRCRRVGGILCAAFDVGVLERVRQGEPVAHAAAAVCGRTFGCATIPASNSAGLMRIMLSYRAGDESIASILRT